MERVWAAREYREGDEEGVFELDKAVHPSSAQNKQRWMGWWQWMYKQNPAGAARIWLAEHEGRVVGQSAVIPVAMKVGSEIVTGFQAMHTMTHPEYRRQGIYETIAKKTYAEAAKKGMHIGYRFPNENSHPIAINKLNWFDVATMQIVFKPLNWGNALKLRINNRFLLGLCTVGGNMLDKMFYRAKEVPFVEGLTITRVSSFDERISEFCSTVSNQYPIMVMRSVDYLNWRYITVPDVEYSIYIAELAGEIHGYLVLRCIQKGQARVGAICDIFAQSEQIAQCLISEAIGHFEREEVDLVYCEMIKNKILHNAFKRSGFVSVPFIRGMRLCAYSSSPDIPKEFLQDSQNWLIQIGDSDSV